MNYYFSHSIPAFDTIASSNLPIFRFMYSVLFGFVSIYIMATAIFLPLFSSVSMKRCLLVRYASRMRRFNKLRSTAWRKRRFATLIRIVAVVSCVSGCSRNTARNGNAVADVPLAYRLSITLLLFRCSLRGKVFRFIPAVVVFK